MQALLNLTTALLRCTLAFFRSRNEQAIVELALRQQLATYAQVRPPISREVKALIRRLAGENDWRARIIHFDVSTNPTAQWLRSGSVVRAPESRAGF